MNQPISATRRMQTLGLILAVILLGACKPAHSDQIAPQDKDKMITAQIAHSVPDQHLSKHKLDDEMSDRGLELFIKMLDPRKLYFYQADVDRFNKLYDTSLDDMAQRGDLTAAYDIFRTFLQRVDERTAMIEQLLKQQHDFTIDEEMIVDKDLLTFPKSEAEAYDRWRKRIKLDLLADKAEEIAAEKARAEEAVDGSTEETVIDDEEDDPITKLERRYHSIQKRWAQTDSDEVLELFLTALVSGYDPHTSYMSPSTLTNFKIRMRLNLEGIGATLQSEDGYTIVKSLVPGGAADRQGELKPEDKIVEVGQGDSGPMVDVVDMKLDDVVDQIRGKPGTTVRLKVRRHGSSPKIIKIERAKIELKDSEAQSKVFDMGEKPDGTPYKIGVIDLPSFYLDMDAARNGDFNFKSTTRDVRVILDKFKEQGVDGVVLDLRVNGGGSLQEAISLTGLFIESGPVVQVKGAEGYVHAYKDNDSGIAWDGPLMVLISKFSASASEILAGAIQDYHRGLIVGDESTHGKGTVQNLEDLSNIVFGNLPNPPEMGALKITMQQFYRPNGDSTQKRGVLSDIQLPSLTTHYDVAEADLDYPVEFDQVDAARFDRFPFVNQAITDQLKKKSVARYEADEDFQQLLRDIQLYLEQKEKTTVTLNEQKFLKEREELYADRKEKETYESMADSGDEGVQETFYLDEAMEIMVDYIQLLQEGGYKYTPSKKNNAVLDFLFSN